jgi:hypothetical protein
MNDIEARNTLAALMATFNLFAFITSHGLRRAA